MHAEVTIERLPDKAVVRLDDKLFTEYRFLSGAKPILWPILGPTGKAMTRAYPMEKVSGKKPDHIHHRSMWFTHGSVNGVDFWGEEARHGTTQQREIVKAEGGKTGLLVARNDWLGPDGKKLCEDERVLQFGGDADVRWIDFVITIRATQGEVKFGDTKEGSFGLRVADSMRVEAHRGGRIINSEGQSDDAAWGKPAAWVDYQGPVDGETLGIAIFNHPTSFHYPTRWHVRTYGLFAANPFGERDFAKNSKTAGGYTLPAGKSLTLRYRVLFHQGDEKTGKVAQAFAEYARQPPLDALQSK
jgi:hypothetical protein